MMPSKAVCRFRSFASRLARSSSLMPRVRYPAFFNAPKVFIVNKSMLNSALALPDCSPAVPYVIFKNIFTQAVQCAVKCLTAVGLCEFPHDLLKVGVTRDHK